MYATSEVGHRNYEVFLIDADPGTMPTSPGPVRYGTTRTRVTHAPKADVLPAFNRDGTTMIWTSQRSSDGNSQLWVADFNLPTRASPDGECGMLETIDARRYLIPFRSQLLPHVFTDTLVIGGGVAGMQAALEASSQGGRRHHAREARPRAVGNGLGAGRHRRGAPGRRLPACTSRTRCSRAQGCAPRTRCARS